MINVIVVTLCTIVVLYKDIVSYTNMIGTYLKYSVFNGFNESFTKSNQISARLEGWCGGIEYLNLLIFQIFWYTFTFFLIRTHYLKFFIKLTFFCLR